MRSAQHEEIDLECAGAGSYCVLHGCQHQKRYGQNRKKIVRKRKGAYVRISSPSSIAPEFTRDEIKLIRSRFEDWKREQGVGLSGRPITSHPTFRIALARLTNEHGYSLTDVAIFLGISRERVRQLANASGIRIRRGGKMRIWDNEQNRFVLCENTADYHRRVELASDPLGGDRVTEKRRRIARWVLLDLGEMLGRTPVHMDLADAFNLSAGRLNGIMGISNRHGSITKQCNDLWRRAGFKNRPNATIGGRGRPDREHKPIGTWTGPYKDRHARREAAIGALRDYVTRHEEIPTASMLGRFMKLARPANLGSWLAGRGDGWRGTLDRLWLDAGVGFRPKYTGTTYAEGEGQ
jgi:hypothetical protein